MKTIIASTVAAFLLASQAQALSCLRPDVARTFNWVAAAEESFVVLLGEFSFATGPLKRRAIQDPQSAEYQASFSGSYLGAEGFQPGPPLDLTMNFMCVGPWCGSLSEDEGPILAFVEQTPDGYVLNVDPCFSTAFYPTATDIARVEACIRGEGCAEVDPVR